MDAIIRSLRSANYGDFFTFEFRQQADGHFDIYCVKHPERAPAMDFWRGHLARDGKIDVPPSREARTVDRALVIATVWAQRYSQCRREAERPAKKMCNKAPRGRGIQRIVFTHEDRAMSSVITQRYRQKPYGDTYTIEYRRQSDGHYDIFATEHPQNPFDESVVKCHLYSSGEVCVAAGKEPRTLDRAKAIAFTWMDGYSAYCRTGNFPTGSKRVNV